MSEQSRTNGKTLGAAGVGLAFIVGVAVFSIAFMVVRRLRGPDMQPLIPAGQRIEGALEMQLLAPAPAALPAGTAPVAGALGTQQPAAATQTAGMNPPATAPTEAMWSLADQKGKVVVVNYFATWCVPCVAETPLLVRLAKEYRPRGVIFAGVAIDRNDDQPGVSREQTLREFTAIKGIDFPILLPRAESILWKSNFTIPQTFIYDKSGRRAQWIMDAVEEASLRATLETLLKEPG